MVRYLTFEMIHAKRNIGSTRLRVHNMIKYWPEAGIYKYGENPDVLIFQKVYATQDYKLHHHFEGIKILDICDPDWFDGSLIVETANAVDGITCPTEPLAEFIRQFTDKPIKVIPDRHDLADLPKPKVHSHKAKRVVWFGYKQNAELLQFALPTLEQLNIHLTVISNSDPMAYRYANNADKFKDSNYTFKLYDPATVIRDLQQSDICILPTGGRPQDRFKSNNKSTLAWLAGLPVAYDGDDLRALIDPKTRQAVAVKLHKLAISDYDVKRSVSEMQEFIEELSDATAS